jgi:hypothetical protein
MWSDKTGNEEFDPRLFINLNGKVTIFWFKRKVITGYLKESFVHLVNKTIHFSSLKKIEKMISKLNQEIEDVYDDPITQHYGCGGEVTQKQARKIEQLNNLHYNITERNELLSFNYVNEEIRSII